MDKIFTILLETLLAGGHSAIISLLVVFIIFLVWDRLKLIKSSKDTNIEYRLGLERVLEKYHQGQIDLIQAFNEIKVILAKLEGKL